MRKYAAAAFLIGTLNHPAFAAPTFQESWSSPDISLADPSQYSCSSTAYAFDFQCNIPSNKTYGALDEVNPICSTQGPNTCYTVETNNNRLKYHGYSEYINGSLKVNFELISRQTFDKNTYISVEAVMSAACQPAEGKCFTGLALFNGESNYREIAYANQFDNTEYLDVERVTNCEQRALISPVGNKKVQVRRNEFHKLRLDYYGHVTGGKWIYYLDDVVQWIATDGTTTEPPYVQPECPTDGNNKKRLDQISFRENPRLGLYLLGNTMRQTNSTNDGYVGPVSVYTGVHPIEEHLVQADGIGLTNTTWIAQLALMGSGGTAAQNITMTQLFLVDGQDYIVEAHLNNGGIPGELINSAPYKATGTGLQYVPLWVPNNHLNFWIVVKGRNGTSAIGTKPHAANGYFLTTVDGGLTWTPAASELTFGTYTRK